MNPCRFSELAWTEPCATCSSFETSPDAQEAGLGPSRGCCQKKPFTLSMNPWSSILLKPDVAVKKCPQNVISYGKYKQVNCTELEKLTGFQTIDACRLLVSSETQAVVTAHWECINSLKKSTASDMATSNMKASLLFCRFTYNFCNSLISQILKLANDNPACSAPSEPLKYYLQTERALLWLLHTWTIGWSCKN